MTFENVSSYLTYAQSEITEWEFLAQVAKLADCYLLLDVNNVYVSARNHNFDPLVYIHELPYKRVKEIHLAGHSDSGNFLLDTHDTAISDPVWQLYRASISLIGHVPTLIERDANLPPFNELVAELELARKVAHE